MKTHRGSYMKTVILAFGCGTFFMLCALMLIQAHATDIPGLRVMAIAPPVVVWGGSAVLSCVGLLSYLIGLGGIVALHYDAKGRGAY